MRPWPHVPYVLRPQPANRADAAPHRSGLRTAGAAPRENSPELVVSRLVSRASASAESRSDAVRDLGRRRNGHRDDRNGGHDLV